MLSTIDTILDSLSAFGILFLLVKKVNLPPSGLYICYESPKKKVISHMFEHLIHNIKTHNGTKI